MSKVDKICPICNKKFIVYKSNENRFTTCGDHECRSKYRLGKDRGGKIKIICAVCGEDFETFKSRQNTRKVCHKPECLAKIRSYNTSGDKCHFWQNGKSFEPYCPKFNDDLKRRVRAFFNYTCLGCGINQKETGEKLSVHHVGYNKESCCDNSIPLFAPLCRRCHASTNNHREYWEGILKNKILLEYDGKCYLPKEK